MAEVHLRIDQSFVDEVNCHLTIIHGEYSKLSAQDIAREALAVYKWVVEHTAAGRAVVAANKNLDSLVQIATPQIPARDPTV